MQSTHTRARSEQSSTKWARRRDIPIAILAWITVAFIILWAAAHLVHTLLLLAIAALLAYALAPGVTVLQRFLPRFLAILIVYLLVLGVIGFLVYMVVNTAIAQVGSLALSIRTLLTPNHAGQLSPLEQTLRSLGISSEQLASFRTQITTRLSDVANSAVPVLTGLFDAILNIVLVAVLSIYLLIDGARVSHWIRHNAPQAVQARFVLSNVQRIVGGYIRGQFLLAVLVGVLVGGGMFIFHVPYALLLGVLAFVLEFIPVLGTLISGAVCTLLALTQGWLIALLVLGYFVVVHVIEGDVVGPRIVGRAIGLHPVVSIAALIAGAELFGIWGALFASPIAGVLQVLIAALWRNWRGTHPEQFGQVKAEAASMAEETLTNPSGQQIQEACETVVESGAGDKPAPKANDA